jgi:hypothetical protein
LGTAILVFGDIYLFPGLGRHELTLRFSHSATWLDKDSTHTAPLLLTARIYLMIDTQQHWLGDVPERTLALRGYEIEDDLVLALDDSQLLALEAERRQGSALHLVVKLCGTLLNPPEGIYPVSGYHHNLFVPESSWLQCLDRVGAEVGITIRVSSPLTDPGALLAPPSGPADPTLPSRTQVVTRLRQARSQLFNGQYENSVATCRLVLDGLNLLFSLPSTGEITKQTRERSQADRWAMLNHDVHSLLSGAHHDDRVTSAFIWSRTDAEAVLAIVSALAMRTLRLIT